MKHHFGKIGLCLRSMTVFIVVVLWAFFAAPAMADLDIDVKRDVSKSKVEIKSTLMAPFIPVVDKVEIHATGQLKKGAYALGEGDNTLILQIHDKTPIDLNICLPINGINPIDLSNLSGQVNFHEKVRIGYQGTRGGEVSQIRFANGHAFIKTGLLAAIWEQAFGSILSDQNAASNPLEFAQIIDSSVSLKPKANLSLPNCNFIIASGSTLTLSSVNIDPGMNISAKCLLRLSLGAPSSISMHGLNLSVGSAKTDIAFVYEHSANGERLAMLPRQDSGRNSVDVSALSATGSKLTVRANAVSIQPSGFELQGVSGSPQNWSLDFCTIVSHPFVDSQSGQDLIHYETAHDIILKTSVVNSSQGNVLTLLSSSPMIVDLCRLSFGAAPASKFEINGSGIINSLLVRHINGDRNGAYVVLDSVFVGSAACWQDKSRFSGVAASPGLHSIIDLVAGQQRTSYTVRLPDTATLKNLCLCSGQLAVDLDALELTNCELSKAEHMHISVADAMLKPTKITLNDSSGPNELVLTNAGLRLIQPAGLQVIGSSTIVSPVALKVSVPALVFRQSGQEKLRLGQLHGATSQEGTVFPAKLLVQFGSPLKLSISDLYCTALSNGLSTPVVIPILTADLDSSQISVTASDVSATFDVTSVNGLARSFLRSANYHDPVIPVGRVGKCKIFDNIFSFGGPTSTFETTSGVIKINPTELTLGFQDTNKVLLEVTPTFHQWVVRETTLGGIISLEVESLLRAPVSFRYSTDGSTDGGSIHFKLDPSAAQTDANVTAININNTLLDLFRCTARDNIQRQLPGNIVAKLSDCSLKESDIWKALLQRLPDINQRLIERHLLRLSTEGSGNQLTLKVTGDLKLRASATLAPINTVSSGNSGI